MPVEIEVPREIVEFLGENWQLKLLEPWILEIAEDGRLSSLSLAELEACFQLSRQEVIDWCRAHGIDPAQLKEDSSE